MIVLLGRIQRFLGNNKWQQVDYEISLQKSVNYEWMDSPIGAVGTLLFQSSHLKKSEIAI